MRNPIRCDAQSNKPFLARLSGILLQIGRLRDSRAALQGSFSTGGFSHPRQNVDQLSVQEILRKNGAGSEKITSDHITLPDHSDVLIIGTREFEKIFRKDIGTGF
jgi:hypothetical protein